MEQNTILIRTDASSSIGAGHVLRCLALAQAWKATGGSVYFLVGSHASSVIERLRSDGMEVLKNHNESGSITDAAYTLSVAKKTGASWIVVDGYQFKDEYYKQIGNSGIKLLIIDDNGHLDKYCADIVLNQNAYASMDLYPAYCNYTVFLLGSRYTLLRKEFLERKNDRKLISPDIRSILITLGGADPDNVTQAILLELEKIIPQTEITVKVIVGELNPHYDTLKSRFADRSWCIFFNAPKNMAEHISHTDIAITAAGTTCWEMAFFGIPMITVVLSENQKKNAAILEKCGAALSIGGHTKIREDLILDIFKLIQSKNVRERLSQNAMTLVDGQGSARVVMHMQDERVRLRNVVPEDCRLLWEWANDPEVRKNAFNQDYIKYSTHNDWFNKKLNSHDSFIFIAVDRDDTPVGQVRFDSADESALVDISIDPKKRKLHYGKELLEKGIAMFFNESAVESIYAYVKLGNTASRKIFENAGFLAEERTFIKEFEVIRYTYKRSGYAKGN